MERFNQREHVLLGYSPQRSFEINPSPRTHHVDFCDVFGGPPRRSSTNEMRYSSSSGAAMAATDSEDSVSSRSPLSGFSEKPVFGEESTLNRRRYPSDEFYDDIFRGDESYSSPRRSDRSPLGSAPGSCVLSPLRPLPPKAEPFGTLLPPKFSHPAKLTKAMDLPAFGSGNRSPSKLNDGSSNGINYPYGQNDISLSRLSSQALRLEQDDLRNVNSSSCQSRLSHEISRRSSQESSHMTKFVENNIRSNLKEDSKPSDINHFHFSIYKWAGKGVPLLMPLRGRKSLKSTEKGRYERCTSSNGRIEIGSIVCELSTSNLLDIEALFPNHAIPTDNESFKREGEKQDKASTHSEEVTSQIVEEEVLKKPHLKSPETMESTVENVLGNINVFSDEREETKSNSLLKIGLFESIEKETPITTQEAPKPELKPLRSLFHEEIEGQGDEDIIIHKTEGKENVAKMTQVPRSNVDASKNAKKHDGKRLNSSNRAEVNKARVEALPTKLKDNLGRSGVKGKVKDFVKIFNQEASSKPKMNADTPSQSCRWKATRRYEADYEPSANTTGMDKKMHLLNVNKMSDTSSMVGENVKQDKQHSDLKTTTNKGTDHSSGQKDASTFSESIPHGPTITLGNIDDLFQDTFLMKELSPDHGDKLPQTGEYEAIQVLDAKIREWSNGKKGNIRSLLSTLQYVLWPESGWKPVALVDIIEGSGVKRAYQKALLYLHPDKLQQKGAASHQKYTAEKVFDILQEAWEYFNSLGAL